MVDNNCTIIRKTQFYKATALPERLDRDSFYIIGNQQERYADLYITDKIGNPKIVMSNERLVSEPPSDQLIVYKSDIVPNDSFYYYGYEYQNYWKIIRTEQNNVIISSKATGTDIFLSNWNNRENLVYN